MKVVTFADVESGSPNSAEWHAWRAQGIGGSDAGVIAADQGMIAHPPKWFKSANELWELKTGKKEDDFTGNWATRRGTKAEPIIRELYEKRTGLIVAPMFGEMDEWPVLRSSFDGVTLDMDVLAEVKCPGAVVHQMAKDREVVPYYKAQLVHQALTAWGYPDKWMPDYEHHFVSGVPESRDIAIVRNRAKRMKDYAYRLFDAEQAFWAKVQEGVPVAGGAWLSMAELWLAADKACAAAKAEKEAVESMMAAYLKQQQLRIGEGGGVRMKEEPRKGAVDYQKLLAAKGIAITDDELDNYRKAGTSPLVVRKTSRDSD